MKEFQNPEPGKKFMSNWLDKLPENTVIDKGLTGCGATTLAIKQEKDTIIAVPFVPLVVNKATKEEHRAVLLGLHGHTDDNFLQEISEHLETHQLVKIMTTYDSLPKVCATLSQLGRDPYQEMQLVIDEWHLLLMSYGFRGETIRNLLNEARQFQDVVYLSATPIERKYWFPEMDGLRDWKIVWPNAKKVQVSKVRASSPVKTVAAMCRNRILDGGEINYHFFMNSVFGIKEAVEKGGLSPDNCRIICADNKDNRAKLPKGFSISTPGDPAKPINFYTSTCFEGCDILDENGRTFIVCDPHRPTTLLDISTSMLQICGRIRDSRFRGQMTLIFNTTRYEEEETLDQFVKRIERETAEAEQNAAWLNAGPSTSLKGQVISSLKHFDSPFIRFDGEQVIIDQNMINLDIISYMIIHDIYATQVNLDEGLDRNGFEIVSSSFADGNYIELMAADKIGFKECCEQYSQIKPEPGTYSLVEDERLPRLRNLCPEACEAVDKLGIEEVRRMKYHKQNIHRKLVSICTEPQADKIRKELSRRLKQFIPYTAHEVKKILGEIYYDVGLERTPKATELEDWLKERYLVRTVRRSGKDAYIIEGDRFMRVV